MQNMKKILRIQKKELQHDDDDDDDDFRLNDASTH